MLRKILLLKFNKKGIKPNYNEIIVNQLNDEAIPEIEFSFGDTKSKLSQGQILELILTNKKLTLQQLIVCLVKHLGRNLENTLVIPETIFGSEKLFQEVELFESISKLMNTDNIVYKLGDHNLFYISGNSDQSEIGYTTYYNTKIKESLDKKIILPPNSKSPNQSFEGENIDLSSLYLYAKFSADPVGYCYLSQLISSESTKKVVRNFLETLNLEDMDLFSFTKRNVLYFRILRFYKDFISQEIGNQSISIEQFVSKPSNKYRNLSLLLEYIYTD